MRATITQSGSSYCIKYNNIELDIRQAIFFEIFLISILEPISIKYQEISGILFKRIVHIPGPFLIVELLYHGRPVLSE